MHNAIYIWLSIFVFRSANCVEPPDLLLVAKPNNEHICIADGNVYDSAIGWIFPIGDNKDTLPQIVSNFIPQIKNEYDCNFSKTKYCSNVWQMEDWQYSNFSSHDLKPTLDTRWENYPVLLTSNLTKEFGVKTAIPQTFHIGLSVRTEKNAEIFLCEGWNPYNSACYYINIGGPDNKQAVLKKYKNVPEKILKNETKLAKYKSDVNILSDQEWKTFGVTLDGNGTLNVIDTFNNAVLINYTDNKQLKPIYLFFRSRLGKALWKIHNNQFIFTNKTRSTQLGPTFNIKGHNLCVSLYISICKLCKMNFFITLNGENRTLQEVSNKNAEDSLTWKKIKLVHDSVYEDNIKLFVETKYSNNSVRNGFWAIDDVRMCTKNEIKVTRMLNISSSDVDKSNVSCQALQYPTWRPTLHVIKSPILAEEVLNISSKPTSIRLTWKKPVETEDFQRYYIVHYEGSDISTIKCPNPPINKKRSKSRNFLISRVNNIIIKDLIPYSHYNITLLNLIEDTANTIEQTTLATDKPSKEELPKKIKVNVTEDTALLEWASVKCNETYGPVLHEVKLWSEGGSNNRSVTEFHNYHRFQNLLPFTKYKVQISTARMLQYLNDTEKAIRVFYSFTTLPGVAPKVENLELYAISRTTANLRFNLAKSLRGIPVSVHVRSCTILLLDTCNSAFQNVTKCQLWQDKYCLEVINLPTTYNYSFFVSVKNADTHTLGEESKVAGVARERVPGSPLNLTYKVIDCIEKQNCCSLNLSWAHPYYQNGTITMFDILLNKSTSYSIVSDGSDSIYATLKVIKKQYQPVYSTTITYIPCNTSYEIYVWAVNAILKGKPATTSLKAKKIPEYIDQSPKFLNSSNETITFQLPSLDWRLRSSKLILIAQDYNQTEKAMNNEITNLGVFHDNDKICSIHGKAWVASSVDFFNNSTQIVTVGDKSKTFVTQLNKTVINKPLNPNTEYCLTFILLNKYEDIENVEIYHERNVFTEPTLVSFNYQKEDPHKIISPAAYVVPVLLIILIAGFGTWFTYKYLRARRRRQYRENNGEHVYESMPFDDYMPGSFANRTYDKLIHD